MESTISWGRKVLQVLCSVPADNCMEIIFIDISLDTKRRIYFEVRHNIKVKGKVYPRTGREGPEGEKRYSSTLSLTSALDGVGCLTPRPGRFSLVNDQVPTI
jgi:hypothetical protein